MDGSVVDVRMRAPATTVIAGPTGSGKTVLLKDLIAGSDTVTHDQPHEIVYCYSEWQRAYDEMRENSPRPLRFVRGMIDPEDEIPKDGRHRWLVVDDLMDELVGKSLLDRLFTVLSHHLNLSVFLVVQNLFQKGLRTLSVNTHYFFLGKNPRDASSITNLAKQMAPGETKGFVDAYKEATKEPYSFLMVSARQETPDHLRLLGNYARPDKTMIAYA